MNSLLKASIEEVLIAQGEEIQRETCPEHGEQIVTHESSTRGCDPYNVSHLSCGHRVTCFGPGEENIILGARSIVLP